MITDIFIVGTYDELADSGTVETCFQQCQRDEATHVSVYTSDGEEATPVVDYLIDKANPAKAHQEAALHAAGLSLKHLVRVTDQYK